MRMDESVESRGVSRRTQLLFFAAGAVALVVLVAIVAWTMGPLRKRRPPDVHDERDVPPKS